VDAVPTSGYRRILPAHQWFWDGTEHVDPAKEAKAQAKRLENHTTTLAHEYARQGKDWEAELRQRAREKELQRELGLTEKESTPATDDKSELEDRVEELEDGASEND
jgi:capsid protein